MYQAYQGTRPNGGKPRGEKNKKTKNPRHQTRIETYRKIQILELPGKMSYMYRAE